MPSRTFNYQDGWQSWTIPDRVDEVTITCDGAGAPGNGGGRVHGKRKLGGGTKTLKILIGQQGGSSNGQNGGRTAQGGGGPGGDGNSGAGGDGGGGGTFVRLNSNSGTLVCAAGGGGGNSGDLGAGGRGGGSTGENGARGNSGNNSTSNATGGTQSQPGRGGGSSSGGNFDGHNGASGGPGSRGGAGGDPKSNYGHGGGGGGGGFRPGGGGQASSKGYAPGGGGGGGSNYTGGLTGSFSTRGAGGAGHGQVVLEWSNPPPPSGGGGGTGGEDTAQQSHRPTNPGSLRVDGGAESANKATKSTGRVAVSAQTRCPLGHQVRIKVGYDAVGSGGHYSNPKFEYSDWKTSPASGNATCSVTLTGLAQDQRYEIRVYALCKGDKQSSSYNSSSFWTNRGPDEPTLNTPADNAQFSALVTQAFNWTHHDPDPSDSQTAYQIRWRPVSTGFTGPWLVKELHTSDNTYVSGVREFKGNTFYEWSVRTRDEQNHWGVWADPPRSFYATGVTAPPIPLSPIKNAAADATDEITFTWQFKDPVRTDAQVRADLRYRVVDLDAEPDAPGAEWVTVIGNVDPGVPGTQHTWTFPAGRFAYPGYRYEWQVRTYDAAIAEPSDWSASAFFVSIGSPGGAAPDPPTANENFIQGSLGCGSYKVCIYDRGGQTYRGEITPISQLQFGRLRDDISSCTITTIGFGSDCGVMLKRARSWMHELVVFRDGLRVWEGPITRITYTRDSVSFEAKDCMAYLYRRIMRQGYNDGFQGKQSETAHGRSVVERAYQIALNALAYQDPNLLPYITAFIYDNDARQTRIVPDYSQTAWQQIDDLAANAGLDYVTVGRRIMFWDTHRPIGRLPEMRDGDFSDPPIVTEYGMQLATFSAVTRGDGRVGTVSRVTDREPFLPNGHPNPDFDDWYGPVEMLASSYSETDNESTMTDQAKRNIAHRWPTPVVVRVPDNSTLNPETNVGFEQLIPGVWIPLRSDGTLRVVEQWQKLDSVTVTFEGGTERVAVVMSPAPNGGQDPDAGGGEDDGGDE
jgi:hypothetical protein